MWKFWQWKKTDVDSLITQFGEENQTLETKQSAVEALAEMDDPLEDTQVLVGSEAYSGALAV
jgi:hypothetical protein